MSHHIIIIIFQQDISEVKAYGRPPTLVETVMQAVMILKGCDPSWAEAKRQLGESVEGVQQMCGGEVRITL